MASACQNTLPPSLSHGRIGLERQAWPPRLVLPLPEVPPPSRRTRVATPEFGTVAGLDHENHTDEDGCCSTSYRPLPRMNLHAATCAMDLPPPQKKMARSTALTP